jgi:hypothetical protein
MATVEDQLLALTNSVAELTTLVKALPTTVPTRLSILHRY